MPLTLSRSVLVSSLFSQPLPPFYYNTPQWWSFNVIFPDDLLLHTHLVIKFNSRAPFPVQTPGRSVMVADGWIHFPPWYWFLQVSSTNRQLLVCNYWHSIEKSGRSLITSKGREERTQRRTLPRIGRRNQNNPRKIRHNEKSIIRLNLSPSFGDITYAHTMDSLALNKYA